MGGAPGGVRLEGIEPPALRSGVRSSALEGRVREFTGVHCVLPRSTVSYPNCYKDCYRRIASFRPRRDAARRSSGSWSRLLEEGHGDLANQAQAAPGLKSAALDAMNTGQPAVTWLSTGRDRTDQGGVCSRMAFRQRGWGGARDAADGLFERHRSFGPGLVRGGAGPSTGRTRSPSPRRPPRLGYLRTEHVSSDRSPLHQAGTSRGDGSAPAPSERSGPIDPWLSRLRSLAHRRRRRD